MYANDKEVLAVLVEVLEDSIKSFGDDFADRKLHAQAAIQACNALLVKTEARVDQGPKGPSGSVGPVVPVPNADACHLKPYLLDYSALPLPDETDDLFMNDQFDLNVEIARAKEQPFFNTFMAWMRHSYDVEDDFEFGNADHGDPADHFNDYVNFLLESGHGKRACSVEDRFGFVFNTLSFSAIRS